MRALGELCLLGAFVSSGFAAFACLIGGWRQHRLVRRAGVWAGVAAVLALTVVTGVLAWALYTKDFAFAYVAQYSSKFLPWHYALSALWVGQAGSLLVWAWFLGVLALGYYWQPGRASCPLREPVFGSLMGYLCFLAAVMAFAADPMEASVSAPRDGLGLSPLLQHPAMLIHPPIVFLGYALWTVPFALAGVALLTGRLDAHWVRQARPWALVAWTVLGVGILWGADWAYEELGWGGYWAWDPVENGSLIPWLTGTALIHSLMAWQHGRVLKKTTVCLAVATFALCNFATFLTRSGIFSSLHAFSESPIGWLFLALMIGLAASGAWGLVVRRAALAPERPIRSVFSREAFVLVAAVALVLLAAIAVAGTLSSALSNLVVGRAILVGPAFYNNVLIPTGLTLLLTTAAAPLLRWGDGPSREQKRYLLAAVCGGGVAAATAAACGTYHPINLAVIGGSALAVLAFAGGVILDGKRAALGVLQALGRGRRQYAGFLMHLGFVCLAIGVTGSSLGKREQGFTMTEGQTVEWAGRSIRLARVFHRELPDKLVAEAELEVSRGGRWETTLTPAQHFHRLQREWTTEVAIHSTWSGDFYTILHSGTDEGQLSLTFVENPLMRWMWLGGGVIVLGTVVRLWPTRRRAIRRGAADKRARQQVAEQTSHRSPVPPPHRTRKHARRWAGEP